jgi:DNA-directed RNA polymerase subunit RPC12/RpoP
MSTYIGKRVSYPCGQCGKQFTLNSKSVDDSQKSGKIFCSKKCFDNFYLHDLSVSLDSNEQLIGAWHLLSSLIRKSGTIKKSDLSNMANRINHVLVNRKCPQ